MTTAFHEHVEGDLLAVSFRVRVDGETAPGAVWMPADLDEPAPLVFLQHPLTSSKDDYFVADTARAWALRGWICAGLDAPLHGERDEYDPLSLLKRTGEFPAIASRFAAEVSTAIDALAGRFPVDLSRVGYVGFSLGSMLGVPAVAIDGRFRAAAFCLVGEGGLAGPARGEGSYVPGLGHTAVRIVARTQDEVIPRAATEALYEAIEGDKDLVWLPGSHFDIGPDVIDAAGAWMRQHLA